MVIFNLKITFKEKERIKMKTYQKFYKLKSKGNYSMGTARLLTLTWKLQQGGPRWTTVVPDSIRTEKGGLNLHQKVSLRREQKPKTGDKDARVLLPHTCLQKDIALDPFFREVMEKETQ